MRYALTKLGQPAQPPYTIADYPIGSAILDSTGYNVLSFPDAPGAKFADRATCERIIEHANKSL